MLEAIGIDSHTTAAGIGGFMLGAFAMLVVILCVRLWDRDEIVTDPGPDDVAGDYPNIDPSWGGR